MGGVTRSPFTAIVFAFELTHDANSLLALLVAATVSHLVSVLVLKRSILTEKVARRGFHVMREYAVDPLEATFVREVMDTDVLSVARPEPLGRPIRRSPGGLAAAAPALVPGAVRRACSSACCPGRPSSKARTHRAGRRPTPCSARSGWPIPTRSCARSPTGWRTCVSVYCRSSIAPTPRGSWDSSRSSTCSSARQKLLEEERKAERVLLRPAAPRRRAARDARPSAGRRLTFRAARHRRLRARRGGGLGGAPRVRPPSARPPPAALAGAPSGRSRRRAGRQASALTASTASTATDATRPTRRRRPGLLGPPGVSRVRRRPGRGPPRGLRRR